MAIKINGATVIADNQAFTTTSTISATGNITTAGTIIGNVQSTGPISTSGNVTGGNILTGGLISATGNITGNYILGNGSQLTGIDATSIQNGTANVRTFNNGNVTTSAGGTANVLNVTSTGTITTGTASATGDILGGANLSITGNSFTMGTSLNTVSINNGTFSIVGNIQGGNLKGALVSTYGNVVADGNITGGNILTAGLISATGNITAANLNINGNAVITGNLRVDGTETIFNVQTLSVNDKDIIVANNVTGGANVDGSGLQAGNPATATWFFNNATTSWQSNVGITPTTNGTLSLGGASNYWSTAFLTTASVTGNVQAGNIRTAGLISATGNINGGNITTAGRLFVTAGTDNIELLNGVISASGNVQAGNIRTTGLISATGAITGAALTGTSLTVSTGNITGGNLLLSGAIIDSAQLDIQTSASNANIALAPNGTGIVTVSTQVSAVGNVTGGNLLTGGSISATGNIRASGFISASGNVAGANLTTTGSIAGGNIAIVMTSGTISAGGNITGGNLSVGVGNITCGNIVNANGNGVGNIGSSSLYFNTVFAKATSAQYADLAEKYTADADYEPGTVVMFGGNKEVTLCVADGCSRVAGVISTNPSYIMNGTLDAPHVATVALTGRVPTKITGTVRKGDLMVSAGNGSARAEANPAVGTVIGKALADHNGGDGVIEVVVGRF